jgi:chemotaxis protein methyltransferase CheR
LSASAPRLKRADLSSGSSLPEAGGLSVTPATFGKFQRLIHEQTGIWLGDAKAALLCGRLARRLRTLKIPSLERYYELVVQSNQHEERVLMIDAITTNETRFFREPRHFDFLERRAIPRWRTEAARGTRPATVRIWSAGCSSGEEPYSLAMLMSQHLPAAQGWRTLILATDISSRMLAQARAGIYNLAKAVDIQESFLKECMLKGIAEQEGQMKVMPEIQAMVEFRKLNLARDPYPPDGHFDVIFCANVLIYFDHQSKQRAVDRLTRCLGAEGLLFVGQAENLSGVNSQLRNVVPSVYTRAGVERGY